MHSLQTLNKLEQVRLRIQREDPRTLEILRKLTSDICAHPENLAQAPTVPNPFKQFAKG